MAKRVVFACSDPREFYKDAVQHAKRKFPEDEVCLRTDFGGIYELAHYPGKLSEHPTIRFMVKHGINRASIYNHGDCAPYRPIVAGMNHRQERDFHSNDLRLFFKRVRNEAIPYFSADLNFQELDSARRKVSTTHHIDDFPEAAAA